MSSSILSYVKTIFECSFSLVICTVLREIYKLAFRALLFEMVINFVYRRGILTYDSFNFLSYMDGVCTWIIAVSKVGTMMMNMIGMFKIL